MQIIASVLTSLLARIRSERGQDILEYALFGGLLAALILAVGAILTVAGANPLETMFNGIEGCIDFDATSNCNPF